MSGCEAMIQAPTFWYPAEWCEADAEPGSDYCTYHARLEDHEGRAEALWELATGR